MNHRYYIREGFGNLRMHGFMTFASTGITLACLIVIGTFALVSVNAGHLLAELENENEMLAFVEDDLSESEARAIQNTIEKIPNVASATFISREEAMENFHEKYADEPLFRDLEPEVFRHRYTVKVTDLQQSSAVGKALSEVNGIAKVNAYEEITGGFIAVRNIALVVCLALFVILFIVAVFIMSNTVKLTTYDRKDEIAIMKMVGASDSFIRWPFVYEGLCIGLLSAALGFFAQWLLYDAIEKGIARSDTISLIHVIPFEQLWMYVAGGFAAVGILIGVLGSIFAIRRFMRV